MRIFTEQALKEYAENHPDSRVALQEWMTALGTAITFWGCCYIGAILSGSEYLLVLRLFRGVKLSQLAVYRCV